MADIQPRGLSRGLTNYGDADFSLYLRRSFASSMTDDTIVTGPMSTKRKSAKFNQIIKATRINTPAFVRILNQIDFHSIQRTQAPAHSCPFSITC